MFEVEGQKCQPLKIWFMLKAHLIIALVILKVARLVLKEECVIILRVDPMDVIKCAVVVAIILIKHWSVKGVIVNLNGAVGFNVKHAHL